VILDFGLGTGDFGFWIWILAWGRSIFHFPLGGWDRTMNEQQFKDRTKQVALRVIKVTEALPSTRTADVLGRQLLQSGTSVGSNYRAACRGKSPADVIAKLAIVEEEADESIYWLELLIDAENSSRQPSCRTSGRAQSGHRDDGRLPEDTP
jgi:four helix bundle protein